MKHQPYLIRKCRIASEKLSILSRVVLEAVDVNLQVESARVALCSRRLAQHKLQLESTKNENMCTLKLQRDGPNHKPIVAHKSHSIGPEVLNASSTIGVEVEKPNAQQTPEESEVACRPSITEPLHKLISYYPQGRIRLTVGCFWRSTHMHCYFEAAPIGLWLPPKIRVKILCPLPKNLYENPGSFPKGM